MKDKKKTAKAGGWQRRLMVVLCVVLSVILVLGLSLTIAWEILVERRLDALKGLDSGTISPEEMDKLYAQTDPVASDFAGPVISGSDVDWGNDPAQTIGGDHIINILLIGQDRREGQGRQRSDAMILCTINKDKKTLTLTSFMRDMYVQIPGYRNNKINACYQIGGSELLNSCLKKNFGVVVDGNVEVDFAGFMEIVDILGGVDIKLTAAEASYLNTYGNWDSGETYDHSWQLIEGMNHLNGEQALAYSRIRKVKAEDDGSGRSDSDYGRTGRQRRVLDAMFAKLTQMGLDDIDKALPLIDKVIEHVATDMDKEQIIRYARELLPILSGLKLVNQRIPADGMYYSAYVDGLDAIVPDLEENRQLLLETLN